MGVIEEDWRELIRPGHAPRPHLRRDPRVRRRSPPLPARPAATDL